MRNRTLLVLGLVVLAASLIGPGVQGGTTGDARLWNHMSGYGHMSRRDDGPTTGGVIEGASEVKVTATEFAFSPDELTVKAGEPVNLTLVNGGDLAHDLVIPDLGVRLVVGPDRQTTAGIEVDTAGSYRYVCSYPGHAEAGMTGLLTVDSNT